MNRASMAKQITEVPMKKPMKKKPAAKKPSFPRGARKQVAMGKMK